MVPRPGEPRPVPVSRPGGFGPKAEPGCF